MFTERLLAGAAVGADDQAERSGPAGRHAGHGVLHHDRPLLVDAELPGGVQNRSGAGLPLRCSCAATTPSTTTANRGAKPAASSTGRALREDDTTAYDLPSASSWLSRRSDPGVRGDALGVQEVVEQLVLPVAERRHRVHAGRVVEVALGQLDVRDARNDRTPSNRGLPSM